MATWFKWKRENKTDASSARPQADNASNAMTEADLHDSIIPNFTKHDRSKGPEKRVTRLLPRHGTFSFYGLNFSVDGLATTYRDTGKHRVDIPVFAEDLLYNGTETIKNRGPLTHRDDYDPDKIAHARAVLKELGNCFAEQGYECSLKEDTEWNDKRVKGLPVLYVHAEPETFRSTLEKVHSTLLEVENSYVQEQDGTTRGKLGAIPVPEFTFHAAKNQPEPSWSARVGEGKTKSMIDTIMELAGKSYHVNSTVTPINHDDFRERLELYLGRSR